MNRFLTLLTVCVVLAIVQAALTALLVALAIVSLYAFVTRPRETLGFICTLVLFSLASAKPIACIVVLGIIALAIVGVAACQRSKCRLLLVDRHQLRLGSRRD